MLKNLKAKIHDMGTIKHLMESAEAHALREGHTTPGAEHFLLAAIDLPDGTARRAFQKAGANADDVRAAIERQYAEALSLIGIAAPAPTMRALQDQPTPTGVYRAAPSGQDVMLALADSRRERTTLLGAHVVAVIADMPHGVAARAIRTLGLDAATLKAAAEDAVRGVSTAQ